MYQLYYAPDNASLIVKILLEELAVDYQTTLVDRSTQQQNSAAYKALNPCGLIPTCIIDGEPIFETAAILLTLAERHNNYFPRADTPNRAIAFKWLFFTANTIHSDLRQLFYPFLFSDEVAINQHRQLTVQRLESSFSIIDEEYAKSQGAYLFGNELSIIDIYLALCLRWAQIYPQAHPKQIDPSDYPQLKKMILAIEQRPAVGRACDSEGIPQPYLSDPSYALPKEGAAL